MIADLAHKINSTYETKMFCILKDIFKKVKKLNGGKIFATPSQRIDSKNI